MQYLNVKLNSFDFFGTVVNFKDTIRVNISTIPDAQRQSYTFNVNKSKSSTASFDVKFDKNVQQIVIVFQKLGHFSSDQVIASISFYADELFNNPNNSGIWKVNICEPLQKILKNNLYAKKINKRKIIGTMVAQFTLNSISTYQLHQINNEYIKNNNLKKDISAMIN